MAEDRHSGQSRRVAHGRRQASGDRRLPPQQLRERKHEQLGYELEVEQETGQPDLDAALDDQVGDDLLRLVFIACHPILSPEARAALTLRLLGGLTTEEIARAFLVPEPTIQQRIVRAKRTLSDSRVPFEVPRGAELEARLSSVLSVIYLIFNEGYSATAGEDWMRPQLCQEALRLGRILAELARAGARGARSRRADGDPGIALRARAPAHRASPCCCSIRTARAGTSFSSAAVLRRWSGRRP